ncbi:MAG TPA: glycosyltransferase family 2 protein [Gemmatimonadaceae bacterium]|nr:glycosyltransferase family 2 protein [Gemmatimonadaceae bacterium]
MSAPAPSPADTYRVETLPVMTRGDVVVYTALTVAAFAALVIAGAYWFALPDLAVTPVPYLLATVILVYQVTAWLLRWLVLPRMRRPNSPPPPPVARVAAATTIVPGAESLEMLDITVQALVAMDGEHDTWVLDEGDEPAVRALCIRHGAHHFSRKNRPSLRTPTGNLASGTKHGNYNAWLTTVGYERYDLLVSFDPDHVPERHYLTSTLGYFHDPQIGYVQAPQVFYNQEASWIARGAAEETYDYYSAHQMASYGLGHPIVVGAHTAHRVAALREAGGFAAHDADDLLITLLYRSTGWRGVYVPKILAAGLTPTSWSTYMGQQARWTRSLMDIKLRSLPGVASRLPPIERLIGLLHGIFYVRSLTVPLAYFVLAWLIGTRGLPAFVSALSLTVVAGLATVLTVIGRFRQRFYLDPVRESGFHWRAMLLQFAKWPALVPAVWHAIRGKRVGYTLTLKVMSPSGRQLVLWPHVAAAVLLLEAWLLGALLDPPISPIRSTLSATVVLMSGSLAWSESWDYPPAFDPALYPRYRDSRLGGETAA